MIDHARRRAAGRFATLAAAALLLGAAARLPAASPRDELLRFVPDDVGLCMMLQDLRGHTARLLNSPFVAGLRASPMGTALGQNKEAAHLVQVQAKLQNQFGLDWDRLRDDVLGEAVVFAYRPGPPGKPQQDQSLVLVRARDAKVLADLVAHFHRQQEKAGQLLELTKRDHEGVTYYRRVDKKETSYYCLRGPVLLFSGQEEMLRQALARERTAPTDAEPLVTKKLRELGLAQALFVLWLNPRALDAEFDAKAAQATPAEAPQRKAVALYWKALTSVGVAVALDKELSVSLALRGRLDRLPSSARRFLEKASGPSEVWRAVPDNSLLALGARLDLAALFEVVGDFMSKDSRDSLTAQLNRLLGAALGLDFVKEVLPALGPDWGLCVLAPPAQEKGWLPQVLVALRVRPGAAAAPADQALLSAVNFSAMLAVVSHNHQHPDRPLSLKVVGQDDKKIKYLQGERCFPPGLQPAFSLQGGYLVLATSLEIVRRFGIPTGGVIDPHAPFPLLRVSFKDCRAYLKERREPLARALAEKNNVSQEEAGKWLDGVQEGLQHIDRLELRQRTTPGQVTFTLALQPSQPLKK
jgi:hypothetical protein